jgi:hypothetical protein
MLQQYYEKTFLMNKPPKTPEVSFNRIPMEISELKEYNITGQIKIFGKPFHYYRMNINWQTDIFSQKQFPMKFSKSLNIRNKNKISARVIWEKNRMQFLTLIAINYKLFGNPQDLEIFQNIISSWISQNPYMAGINWYSSLEVNLRLIVWFFCWNILDVEKICEENKEFKKFIETQWIPSIYQHCHFSYSNTSRFSSSVSPLISEYSALFLASSLWKFPKSDAWFQYALNGLEEEIVKQNSPNGIYREKAAEYIQIITDFFLIPFIIGKKTGNPFSKEYEERLKKIILYIHNFLDKKGNFPKYGDEDNGKCILFTEEDNFNNFKSLVTSGALLFDDPKLLSYKEIDVKNHILLGNNLLTKFKKMEKPTILPDSVFYEEEGHFIFRSNTNQKEIYLHFNASPLGIYSNNIHSHADALSFVLHIDGSPFFIDPGNYTYYIDSDWRKYFIGTLAHNTAKINLKDQATLEESLKWQNNYKTSILSTTIEKDILAVKAQHDGYKKQGIIHTREVIFEKTKKLIRINDTIECQKSGFYFVELPFHLHPGIIVKANNSINFQVSDMEGNMLYLIIDKKLKAKMVKGQVHPQIMGWYSDSFMQKEPCTTIYCAAAIDNSKTFQTIILIK